MITLTDDGTMDTVLRCSDCGEEFRYNYDGGVEHDGDNDDTRTDEQMYDDFVEWAIEDADSDHDCNVDKAGNYPADTGGEG